MYAIISKLDPKTSEVVNTLWEKLCKQCGLRAIYKIPLPHLSWLVAEGLDLPGASKMLGQICKRTSQLTVHVFGLGVFTGEKPVLYLPTVKSHAMISLHEEIWKKLGPLSEDAQLYYSPKLWVPHITLALNDLTEENLPCAINATAFESIELFVGINGLAIAEYDGDKAGEILDQYHFEDQKAA